MQSELFKHAETRMTQYIRLDKTAIQMNVSGSDPARSAAVFICLLRLSDGTGCRRTDGTERPDPG